MGIAIKKARPISKPEAMSSENVSALELIGLVPESKLLNLEITPPVRIIVGARVAINHHLFSWVQTHQKGDEGTVVKVSVNPVPCLDKTRYDVFDVELDNYEGDKKVVAVSRWEIDLIQ